VTDHCITTILLNGFEMWLEIEEISRKILLKKTVEQDG